MQLRFRLCIHKFTDIYFFKLREIISSVIFLACILFSNQTWASSTCPAIVQINHYEPLACYYEFDRNQCVDKCSSADPGFNTNCFREISIPCDIKQEIENVGAGFQQRPPYKWFHISDLLNYPQLITELHVTQQELFSDLYVEFVTPPTIQEFSPASDQLKRENYRLFILSEIEKVTSPLRSAGLYRRLSLGDNLELTMNEQLLKLNEKINLFPYFSSSEKENLLNEVELLKNNQLRFWQITSNANETLVANSRVRQLNSRLDKYVTLLNVLSIDKRQYLIDKSLILNSYYPLDLAECATGICFKRIEIDANSDFYQGQDQRLNPFEELLSMLNNEALALQSAYDDNYQLLDPISLSRPDFAGFINQNYQAVVADTSDSALLRLSSAITIAFLNQNRNGTELFDALATNADYQHNGFSTLLSLANNPVLLCSEATQIAPQLNTIQEEVGALAQQGSAIITQMLENGHSPELLAQLNSLLAEVTRLVMLSNSLANIEQFDDDRRVQIRWQLDTLADSQLLTQSSILNIEYIAFDGMFWTPAMSAHPQELIPTIESISTSSGSLLPIGQGLNSPLGSINMVLRQSPYNACQNNNSEVKLALISTNGEGETTHHILTAQLDQL